MKDIRERAVLVQFTDHIWRANIADKAVSDEIATQKEVRNENKNKVGSYRKSLIPKSALLDRRQIGNNARMYHYENTLPWMDGGIRILPAKSIAGYMTKMRHFKQKAAEAEELFLNSYDKFKEEAKDVLGKLFNDADYPEKEVIKGKFLLDVVTFPVPEIKDWRVDIAQKDMDALRKEAMGNMMDIQKQAIMDLWKRLYEVLDKMNERLSADEGVFRDSLVDNVTKMLDLLPVLNITDDKELEKISKEVRLKLVKVSPAVLREDSAVRKQTAKDAQAILKKMDIYMKKGGAK